MSARRKLTDEQVQWLRKQRALPYPDGTLKSYATLAKCVGCSPQHARDIVYGRRRPERSDIVEGGK